jgi:TldD protein
MADAALLDLGDVEIVFPEGVYADVRLERTIDHRITLRDGSLDDVLTRAEAGALLRVMKDGRWYYASTTDLAAIDALLAELAASTALAAGGLPDVDQLMEIHQADERVFLDEPVDAVPLQDKLALLRRYTALLGREDIRTWSGRWMDQRRERRFLSSKGADVRHDYQEAGVILGFNICHDEETLEEGFSHAGHRYSEVSTAADAECQKLSAYLDRCAEFVAHAGSVVPGKYTVILSPKVAGVFAHESFGHKSEADFMLGDPAMLEEWQIGTPVGSELLSIVDDGAVMGSGYSPFDDEGQRSSRTDLIRNGRLTGRLHAAHTAAALDESCTGNARAMSFRFEPIVRMTTTWIEAGELTREALFSGVDNGIFVETYKHGSGMSTFTIAPSLAWRIQDGKIAEPVRVAVLTGNVFETLGEIDGLSDTVEMPFLLGGGCGKFEQWPLSVGFGGPYVRVRKMNVA